MKAEIDIQADVDALAEAGAQQFVALAAAAIADHGCFKVALSGGSTPRALFALLASPRYAEHVPWSEVWFFWGDERCVPPDDPNSNYRMAHETLLARVPVLAERVFRIEGEYGAGPAAARYEDRLRALFGKADLPRLDLVLLGLGEDGHTASLFPGAPSLRERDHWVVPVPHTTPPLPLVDRVTLTPPVLNAAAQVTFLVSGAGKAARLAQVLTGPYQPEALPAQLIHPLEGQLLWLIDRLAARGLDPTLQSG